MKTLTQLQHLFIQSILDWAGTLVADYRRDSKCEMINPGRNASLFKDFMS